MSGAVAGHAATIAIEKDGDASGTFTVIPDLMSDFNFNMMRENTKVTPHGDTIDTNLVGPMGRDPITLGGNFQYGHATHDHLTGLQTRFIDGDIFGIRWRGPSGAANTDEIIASGQLLTFNRLAPRGSGAYAFDASWLYLFHPLPANPLV